MDAKAIRQVGTETELKARRMAQQLQNAARGTNAPPAAAVNADTASIIVQYAELKADHVPAAEVLERMESTQAFGTGLAAALSGGEMTIEEAIRHLSDHEEMNYLEWLEERRVVALTEAIAALEGLGADAGMDP